MRDEVVEFIVSAARGTMQAAVEIYGDDADEIMPSAIVAMARQGAALCASMGDDKGLAMKVFFREFLNEFERVQEQADAIRARIENPE